MTSRRIVVKAEVKDEDLESQHPRVGERKKYFNLVARSMSSEPINETKIKHPRVRKSVGSVRITESTISESTSEEEGNEIVILNNSILNESRKFPEHLFNVEPTQIEEITDSFIVERILEERRKIATPQARKRCQSFRSFMRKLIPSRPRKKILKEIKKSDYENELLPEEEYRMLQEYYLHNGLIQQRKLSTECEVMDNNHEMELNKSQNISNPYEISQTSSSIQSDMVHDLDIDDNTESIQSNETIGKDSQNSIDKFSRQFGHYSEQRFIIDNVLSDFSLRNKTILTEAPVWIEDQ